MVESSRVRAAAACVFQSLLPAQQPATISGFAGMPNASVALVNQETAIVVITTKSDSNGNFAFPSVPATYSFSVQIGGFTR